MADYTSQDTGNGNVGIFVGIAIVVAIILFVLFAGGGATTSTDIDDLAADPALTAPAADTAPATMDAAPAAPATE